MGYTGISVISNSQGTSFLHVNEFEIKRDLTAMWKSNSGKGKKKDQDRLVIIEETKYQSWACDGPARQSQTSKNSP